MKTLIYGSSPVGRWLTLALRQAGRDVTLLAEGVEHLELQRDGIVLRDGLSWEQLSARVYLCEYIDPNRSYELVVVTLPKIERVRICPELTGLTSAEAILFLGEDFSGFERYLDKLPASKVLLGSASPGGGFAGQELVMVDRGKPIYLGPQSDAAKSVAERVVRFLREARLAVELDLEIASRLQSQFALWLAAAAFFTETQGEAGAVRDPRLLNRAIRATREIVSVIKSGGSRVSLVPPLPRLVKRPIWLARPALRSFLAHPKTRLSFADPGAWLADLLEASEEFEALRDAAGVRTPHFDELIATIRSSTTSPINP